MVFFGEKLQYLLLAEQAPVSGHLSPTPLVAAYQKHSRERPAPVTDTFFASRGCPLMRAVPHNTEFKINTYPSLTKSIFEQLARQTTFDKNARFIWSMEKQTPQKCTSALSTVESKCIKNSCASCCLLVENSGWPRPITVLNICGAIPSCSWKPKQTELEALTISWSMHLWWFVV